MLPTDNRLQGGACDENRDHRKDGRDLEQGAGSGSRRPDRDGARRGEPGGDPGWPVHLATDLPPALGGTNQAPSPTALLLSALAGCAVVFVRDTLAPQLGLPVTAVEATVRCESDARGLLGMDDAEPDLRNMTLDVSVESPDGQAAVDEIARIWQERCPIYLALRKPMDIAVQFRAA
ncbi:MAG: OsmC family protein [Actinomycetota bacterium]|nr:OsmC family protein [Actinomycetota bacterium]